MTDKHFKKLIVAGLILPITAGIYAISNDKNSLNQYLNATNFTSNIYSSAKFSENTSLTPKTYEMSEMKKRVILESLRKQFGFPNLKEELQQNNRAANSNQQQQTGYNQQQNGYNQAQQGGYYDGGYYDGGYYDGGYYDGWYQYQSEILDKQNEENFDPR